MNESYHYFNDFKEQNGNTQSSSRSLNIETEAAVILGNVDRQLTTLRAEIEKQDKKEEVKDNETDENQRIVKDLKERSRVLRKEQYSFLNHMKGALDDVTRTQESVTKLLKVIGKCVSMSFKIKCQL